MSNPHLENLKKVQSILLQMHRLLMASQRSDREARTGKAISPTEWMQLMMTEADYAWMKSMLTLISDIDALMDNHIVSEKDLQIIRQDAAKMFLNTEGANSEFYSNYRTIVQNDPDVIMHHGQLRSSILSLPESEPIQDTLSVRRNWHVKPKGFH